MTAPRKIALLALLVAACGDNRIHALDDAPVTPPDSAVCGDNIVQDGEDCDDGDTVADAVCDATCHFTCGNGVVDDALGETCDTSIASGDGACPTVCDDGDACTSDVVSGSGCTATCVSGPITAAADGDGCCPAGANVNTDDDCSAMCGNGVVEAGELCDTGITLGAGACPTTCDDGVACTADTLTGAGSCGATCTTTPITTPADGDGCCPTGGNAGNDDDCLPTCGNGFVDLGETCDTAIASGAGACPATCSDGMACTTDTLVGAGTCTAACVFPPIITPTNGDGCCPTGANNTNDDDCAPTCGNGVVEGTEQCDDGNMNDTDACTNGCTTNTSATAFRFTDLDLRDPHVWLNLTCQDVTDTQFFGISVNGLIQQQITLDGNNDDLYDLSPTIVFRPLAQAAGTTPAQLYFADCTTDSPSACSPGSQAPLAVTATSQTTGTCLAPIAGTTKPYSPAITSATAPCFSTSPTTVTVNIGGIPLTLTDARLGATYVGTPATSLTNGLLMGFISEEDADATMVPLPVIGSVTLSSLLAGGTGNCKTPTTSDKDVYNGVTGWWFYLNFTATQAGWSDN